MATNFNKIIEQLKAEKLSSSDKGFLKNEILKSIRRESKAPTLSPWSNIFIAFRAHTVAFVAVMTVIFTGGGFAVVAEGALPGETLYSLKVNFNEEVRDIIALHPSQKAQWSAEKARRRLQEAETLSGQGRLSEHLEADLQNRFIEHAAEAREAMASLERQQDLVGLMEAASSLESVLSAHRSLIDPSGREGESIALQARTQKEFSELREEEKISTMGMAAGLSELEEGPIDDTLSSSTEKEADRNAPSQTMEILADDSFLKIIEESLEAVSRERERAEESLSSVSDSDLKSAAFRMERKADIRGKVAGNLYAKIKEDISEENRLYAERELDRFADLEIQGQRMLDRGEYSSAVTTYNQASRFMNSLEIFLNSLVTANKIKERQEKEEVSVEGATTTSIEVLPAAEESGLTGSGTEAGLPEEELSTTSSSTASENSDTTFVGRGLENLLNGN